MSHIANAITHFVARIHDGEFGVAHCNGIVDFVDTDTGRIIARSSIRTDAGIREAWEVAGELDLRKDALLG